MSAKKKPQMGLADAEPSVPDSKPVRCFLLGALVNDIQHELAEARQKAQRHGMAEAEPNLASAEARLGQISARFPSAAGEARAIVAGLAGVRAGRRAGGASLSGADASRKIEALEAKSREIIARAQRYCSGDTNRR